MPGSSSSATRAGAVLGIEGHEVLDVGGDQGAAGCRCVGQYLIVGKGDEGRVVDHGQHVMAFGAQLLGDGAGVGRCLGVAGGSDFRVDLVWVRRPVSDGDADKARWGAGVVFDQGDQGILGQFGLRAAG